MVKATLGGCSILPFLCEYLIFFYQNGKYFGKIMPYMTLIIRQFKRQLLSHPCEALWEPVVWVLVEAGRVLPAVSVLPAFLWRPPRPCAVEAVP